MKATNNTYTRGFKRKYRRGYWPDDRKKKGYKGHRKRKPVYIVDPTLINMNDLKDMKPGRIIRVRKAAWGSHLPKTASLGVFNTFGEAIFKWKSGHTETYKFGDCIRGLIHEGERYTSFEVKWQIEKHLLTKKTQDEISEWLRTAQFGQAMSF